MTDDRFIAMGANCELARRHFFDYCNLKAPDFYKPDRGYLVEFCETLQDFIVSDDDVLIINAPPRHGKSRTIGCLVEWVLGKDKQKKIMTGSYNETLSTTFSKGVRDTIMEVKADKYKAVYSDIFPKTKVKKGDAAMNLWSLQGGYNNYLATSPTGTATGFGADLMIIDDLIKNKYEANNANIKDGQWNWFTGTMLSRLEEGGKIIIVMTRWATDDLAGRIIEHAAEYGWTVCHINFKALQDDGTMLCPEILSKASYESKRKAMGAEVADANYQQNPIDIKGRLYSRFKTYTDVPRDEGGHPFFIAIKSYTDTADTGSDNLSHIVYGVSPAHDAYVLDVIHTKDPMEITEPKVARSIHENGVTWADVESNNGGRGFARNVKQILTGRYGNNRAVVHWFYQSQNKRARILSNATTVMERVYFPADWMYRWPEYYDDMTRYQRDGKNAHDDAEDATTGVVEKMLISENASGINRNKGFSGGF